MLNNTTSSDSLSSLGNNVTPPTPTKTVVMVMPKIFSELSNDVSKLKEEQAGLSERITLEITHQLLDHAIPGIIAVETLDAKLAEIENFKEQVDRRVEELNGRIDQVLFALSISAGLGIATLGAHWVSGSDLTGIPRGLAYLLSGAAGLFAFESLDEAFVRPQSPTRVWSPRWLTPPANTSQETSVRQSGARFVS